MNDPKPTSGFGQFLAEMRRRHVGRFAFAYAASAFVVLQLAEIVFPAFGVGEAGLRLLVVATGLAFPPALVLAWMYDLTSEGFQRTGGEVSNPILPRLALGALLIATIAVMGSLGVYLDRQGVFESPTARLDEVLPAVQLASYDPAEPIRSIAVLPLDDYSQEQNQAYFTSSMHEELIAKLSSLDEVRVVSRTSVAQFSGTTMTMPEISRTLNVDVVIEGSVTRSAERTRVTLQLIHAPSDTHIETLQWDREDVGDMLAFQTEIARDVVEQVSSQYDESLFVQTASNVQSEAQDAYMRGRYEYEQGTEESLRMATEYFESALEIEPDFAPAMAGIAGARFLIQLEGDSVSTDEVLNAHEVALEALRIDSVSTEVREVLTLIEHSMPELVGDTPMIPGPTPEQKTVQVLSTSDEEDTTSLHAPTLDSEWVATQTSFGDRIAERMRNRALPKIGSESDRMFMEARQLSLTGQYPEAIERLEQVVADTPDRSEAWEFLARTQVSIGQLRAGVETLDRWRESGESGAPSRDDLEDLVELLGEHREEGYWMWYLDRLDMRRDTGEHVPLIELATAHAGMGNNDEAIDLLVTAIRDGEPGVFSIRSDPVWDELRRDPRLRELGRQSQPLRFRPRRPRGG
ncbi:MAG: tetratricopeptide repeat protein [Gemmatimonadota bacterium]|nr:tetratricopeptide repeat protein [Gemmatimonadota bacterium]